MLIRTSTNVCGAPCGTTLNRNVAPSRTPAGTRSRISCAARHFADAAAGATPLRPRLRRARRSRRRSAEAARRSGTGTPQNASCGLRTTSADCKRFACDRRRTSRACGRARSPPTESRWRPRRPAIPPGRLATQTGVVGPASLRIAQHLVGARHLEEGAAAVVPGDVGMVPPCQLPVGALDFISPRVRRHAQNVVVVPHHFLKEPCRNGTSRSRSAT